MKQRFSWGKRIAMKYFYALAIAGLLCANAVCEERYDNKPYGVDVQTVGAWKITHAAKLQIDLHQLSDEQLDELFDAYNLSEILKLGNDQPDSWITLKFFRGREPNRTAMELAESWERGARDHVQRKTVIQGPQEMEIANVKAASLVSKVAVSNKNLVMHQYFIKRARSSVIITACLPEAASEAEVEEMTKMIKEFKIDVYADKFTGSGN